MRHDRYDTLRYGLTQVCEPLSSIETYSSAVSAADAGRRAPLGWSESDTLVNLHLGGGGGGGGGFGSMGGVGQRALMQLRLSGEYSLWQASRLPLVGLHSNEVKWQYGLWHALPPAAITES